MLSRLRSRRNGVHSATVEPVLSFSAWADYPPANPVAVVCHPQWRGVRTAAYTFRAPVIEVADAGQYSRDIVQGLVNAGATIVVVHGFPPGSTDLVRAAHGTGLHTRCVLHSSPAQHGTEPGEAAVVQSVTELLRDGSLGRVGFVKQGVAEVFSAAGFAASYVPNRAPDVPGIEKVPLDASATHVGIFAEPFWRKNIVTQLGALALMENVTGHVTQSPRVPYLAGLDVVEHGILPWGEFVQLQGSMDLNLYVSLSESHPLSPVESYLSGVPCLVSRTSALFRDDSELWELTTAAEHDNPAAIADNARRLIEHGEEAVTRAKDWIARADRRAADLWTEFTEV